MNVVFLSGQEQMLLARRKVCAEVWDKKPGFPKNEPEDPFILLTLNMEMVFAWLGNNPF
jgi:hypothetical protein